MTNEISNKERYTAVLEIILQKFDKAATPEERRAIVIQQFDRKQIAELSDTEFEAQKENLPETPPKGNFDHTNALAIATSLADLQACKRLLEPFNSTNINEPSLFVRGYRQDYTLMHLALDPLGHVRAINLESENHAKLTENLSQIIVLLAEKGADPNLIPTPRGDYTNPAMAGGEARGYSSLPRDVLTSLRVQLILAGADPDLAGSSFQTGDSYLYPKNEILEKVCSFFKKADLKQQNAMRLVLHPTTLKAIGFSRFDQCRVEFEAAAKGAWEDANAAYEKLLAIIQKYELVQDDWELTNSQAQENAVRAGSTEIIECLLSLPPVRNSLKDAAAPVFCEALQCGRKAILEQLLKANDKIHQIPEHYPEVGLVLRAFYNVPHSAIGKTYPESAEAAAETLIYLLENHEYFKANQAQYTLKLYGNTQRMMGGKDNHNDPKVKAYEAVNAKIKERFPETFAKYPDVVNGELIFNYPQGKWEKDGKEVPAPWDQIPSSQTSSSFHQPAPSATPTAPEQSSTFACLLV